MLSPNIKTRIFHLMAILFSAALLCVFAFYNGYPLTFSNDTGIYLNSAFTGEIADSRPITYGLFIGLMSLHITLWTVVIVQALIVALIVYYIFRYMSRSEGYVYHYIAFVALVSLMMGAGFEVSRLMPDVFTPVTILGTALIVWCPSLKLRDMIVISVITVLSILIHNSHFFICVILLCGLLGGYLFRQIRLLYKSVQLRFTRIILVFGLAISSNLISAGIHYHYGGVFKSSFGGSVFLMANLIEMGVIDPYLKENCGKKNYKLCAYKDSIPNNFLWADNTPLDKTGGWKANEGEYMQMERDLFTSPGYLSKIVYKSVTYTIKQFFNYDITYAGKPSDFVDKAVQSHFPHEFNSYSHSPQNAGMLPSLFRFINVGLHILVGISLFLLAYSLMKKQYSDQQLLSVILIFAGIVVNAWVCSMFSGVYPRYQVRVVWLLPLPLFVYPIRLSYKWFAKK
jgi:hypothetical protein